MSNIFQKVQDRKYISAIIAGVCLLVLSMFASTYSTAESESQMVTQPMGSMELLEDVKISSITETTLEISAAREKVLEKAKFVYLENELKSFLAGKSGTWSVYVKNLETEDSILINNQPIYAASLSKLFVMEYVFQEMDAIKENGYSEESILNTVSAMITVSDNNAYNNLISMSSANGRFQDGCQIVNDYLTGGAYANTGVYHTLHPCDSPWLRISTTRNHTTVEDCGIILEKIYDGTCVSKEASKQMLELLKKQERVWKIPAGLPEGTKTANKTGETDYAQHDAAIVFGPETDYVLCVMSYNAPGAIYTIQDISGMVYKYIE